MKSQFASVAFSSGLALAIAGCATGTGGSSEQGQTVGQQQRHLASASFALENAYDVQYVKGQVDANALQPLIDDVLEAMPEPARPQAQAHIYDVISRGQKDARDLTPEQRARVAAPASEDKMGPQQLEVIGAWGWGPYYGGYGLGMGAYGVGYGAGYGLGWGGVYDVNSSGQKAPVSADKTGAQQVDVIVGGYGLGYGAGYGAAYGGVGYGLGFGGLGAFGFPGYAGFGWGW